MQRGFHKELLHRRFRLFRPFCCSSLIVLEPRPSHFSVLGFWQLRSPWWYSLSYQVPLQHETNRRHGCHGCEGSWMRTVENATPRSACLLALLLSIANPKVLVLAAAAGSRKIAILAEVSQSVATRRTKEFVRDGRLERMKYPPVSRHSQSLCP